MAERVTIPEGPAPDWAIKRALEKFNQIHPSTAWTPEMIICGPSNDTRGNRGFRTLVMDHAHLIAMLETPPVDPIVALAREIVGREYGPTRMVGGGRMPGDAPSRVEAMARGEGDNYWEMRVTVAAIRAGIEMARKEGQGND